jgi:hypothetical protein
VHEHVTPGSNNVVEQQTEEGSVPHHIGRFVDSMSEPQRLLLGHRPDGDVPEAGERVLEAEVSGDHLPNVMVDNNDRLLGPGAGRLLDGILNGWPVNNREQRFGNNAGGGTHPGASPRCWNQGNIDAHVVTFSSVPLAIR